jgi:hypothetical protein
MDESVMPKFKVNKENPHGHFSLTFQSNKLVDFYGIRNIKEIDAFRFHGALPDNQIGVNKLINILGKNLLRLEDEDSELTRKDPLELEKKNLNKFERLSTAMTIGIFDACAMLETARDSVEASQEVFRQSIESVLSIYRVFEKDGYGVVGSHALRLINKINLQKARFEKMRNANPVLIDEHFLRELYQDILDDYNDVQLEITLYQRSFLKTGVFANHSATETYQEASYALEDHVFSQAIPTREQLWKQDTDRSITVSTESMPGMRADRALQAAIHILHTDEDKETFFPSSSSRKQTVIRQNSLHRDFLMLKKRIRDENINTKEERIEHTKAKELNILDENLPAFEKFTEAEFLTLKNKIMSLPDSKYDFMRSISESNFKTAKLDVI